MAVQEYETWGPQVPAAAFYDVNEMPPTVELAGEDPIRELGDVVLRSELGAAEDLKPDSPADSVAKTPRTHKRPENAPRDLMDLQLVISAREGDPQAMDTLIRRYTGFVRLKSSAYFLSGGESDDLLQEGLIGLYKAARDYNPDRETTFRSFAELCITRQIITAIKTATRFKHSPLNTYVSFSHTPSGVETDNEVTLGDCLPGPAVQEPPVMVISTEELQSLVSALGSGLSRFEADSLRLYLDGKSYVDMAEELESNTKSIDNALQRVKHKIKVHQKAREVLL